MAKAITTATRLKEEWSSKAVLCCGHGEKNREPKERWRARDEGRALGFLQLMG
jgi:hypothetical protein